MLNTEHKSESQLNILLSLFFVVPYPPDKVTVFHWGAHNCPWVLECNYVLVIGKYGNMEANLDEQ